MRSALTATADHKTWQRNSNRMDTLTDAIGAYLKIVTPRVVQFGDQPFKAALNGIYRQQDLFEQCETTQNWRDLFAKVKALADPELPKGLGFHEARLKNWFRRSVYLDCLRQTPLDAAQLAARLTRDIYVTVHHHEVTVLALLEGLELATSRLTFRDFEIRRFSEEDLKTLLEVEVNSIFFPRAVTTTHRLLDHFYLVVRIPGESEDPFEFAWRRFVSPSIEHQYSELPNELEKALRVLALWNWNFVADTDAPEFELDEEWYKPKIPFTLVASGNPFSSPIDAPNVNALFYEPIFDGSENEIGERPARSTYEFAAERTTVWERSVREYEANIHVISSRTEWRFVEHALGMMLKAWLSESSFEELLWNVTALESLLGEDVNGLTTVLANRTRDICGGTNARKKAVRKAFSELYDVRCDLVHGAVLGSTRKRHIFNARILTREVAERMLAILSEIADAVESGRLPVVPDRADILEAIDRVNAKKSIELYPLAKVVKDAIERSS